MVDGAGWVALIATCVAALMTASNINARVTGWGFVIFTIGALAWIVVGFATGQTQLLYSNIFLCVVDVFGIWRWLGHRAKIEETSQAEQRLSKQRSGASLFSLAALNDLPILSHGGDVIGHTVDGFAGCDDGRIEYLIVSVGGIGGIGERLHRMPWNEAELVDDQIRTRLNMQTISDLPPAADCSYAERGHSPERPHFDSQ